MRRRTCVRKIPPALVACHGTSWQPLFERPAHRHETGRQPLPPGTTPGRRGLEDNGHRRRVFRARVTHMRAQLRVSEEKLSRLKITRTGVVSASSPSRFRKTQNALLSLSFLGEGQLVLQSAGLILRLLNRPLRRPGIRAAGNMNRTGNQTCRKEGRPKFKKKTFQGKTMLPA